MGVLGGRISIGLRTNQSPQEMGYAHLSPVSQVIQICQTKLHNFRALY